LFTVWYWCGLCWMIAITDGWSIAWGSILRIVSEVSCSCRCWEIQGLWACAYMSWWWLVMCLAILLMFYRFPGFCVFWSAVQWLFSTREWLMPPNHHMLRSSETLLVLWSIGLILAFWVWLLIVWWFRIVSCPAPTCCRGHKKAVAGNPQRHNNTLWLFLFFLAIQEWFPCSRRIQVWTRSLFLCVYVVKIENCANCQ